MGVTVDVSLGRIVMWPASVQVSRGEVLSMVSSCMSVWWTLTSASVLPLGPEASVHILLFQLYYTQSVTIIYTLLTQEGHTDLSSCPVLIR